MVTRDGVVKVLDFGIAKSELGKADDATRDATRAGVAIGTTAGSEDAAGVPFWSPDGRRSASPLRAS